MNAVGTKTLTVMWMVVVCLVSFQAIAQEEEPGEGFDREFLDSLPMIELNESPVAVPVAEDGSLYRFVTARAGMYRVKTSMIPDAPVDSVLAVFRPNEVDGSPELVGFNDDFREEDPGSEVNRFLEGETEYVIIVEPYRNEEEEPPTENADPNQEPVVVGEVGLEVLGPVHQSVYPIGELLDVYEFSEEQVSETGWVEIPGGFDGRRGGFVGMREFPDDAFVDSEDGHGIAVRVRDNELTFLYLDDAIQSTGRPIVIRMRYRATDDDALLFLAALRGDLGRNTDLVGSANVNQVNDLSRAVERERTLELVYRQFPGTFITPLIQIVGTGRPTTIFIDKVTIWELESNGIF